MILGRIYGKITTSEFKFRIEKETRKFEYVQVFHKVYNYVLCQIVEIERHDNESIAKCVIIGYKDKDGKIKHIRIPFDPNTEVLKADKEFIMDIVKLEKSEQGAYIGKLDGVDIPIYLDLVKLLTKHCAILAKSGAGKSYTVGVLIEEIMERKVPLLIIDPHDEYSTLKFENDNKDDLEQLKRYNLKPKAYKIQEYGDTKLNNELKKLKLSNVVSNDELIHLIPGKLSSAYLGMLYSALRNIDRPDFTSLLLELDKEESNAKWNLINIIEYLNNLHIFSDAPTPLNELIQPGVCSIINLKGINPDIQEIITYKLFTDIFQARKTNKIPPFFLVVEEAHNYCPERNFGETKASKVIRNIASEGRKFGLGLCIISQRPARVDKSVLSQCTTQIILKVTNPNDLKAISNSVESITSESEKEIQNLQVGNALVSGVVDIPLFATIRPRKSKHGGRAVDVINESKNILEQIENFKPEEMLPLIMPKTSAKDLALMAEDEVKNIKTELIPCALVGCRDNNNDFNILVELINGQIVTEKDKLQFKRLPEMKKLNRKKMSILKLLFKENKVNLLALKENLGDVEKEIDDLINNNYLVKEENTLSMSDQYIFSKLSLAANFDKINFSKIRFDHKKQPAVKWEALKDELSKFTTVIDKADCFLVHHTPEFE